MLAFGQSMSAYSRPADLAMPFEGVRNAEGSVQGFRSTDGFSKAQNRQTCRSFNPPGSYSRSIRGQRNLSAWRFRRRSSRRRDYRV